MGRRPHPLVVEFFERGSKLADSSNRYAHTCRRCGEEFPKGRIDSLTSHLLRKCPNVTYEDREWVFQQIQHNPERRSSSKKEPANSLPLDNGQNTLDSLTQLPVQQQHQQSALDTLAEVSRRHLDYSSNREHNEQGRDSSGNPWSETITEEALLVELRKHADFRSPVNVGGSTEPHVYPTEGSLQEAGHSPEVPLTRTVALASSPLVQTASAANQHLELVQAQQSQTSEDESLVDPQLGETDRTPQPLIDGSGSIEYRQGGLDIMRSKPTTISMAERTAGSLFAPLNEHPSELGLLQKTNKSKKRGRFDDTRRKEVSEIRKRGACIRCRMLKKPCSEETPCSTCRTVESARLWKGKCLRTRLADEFTLWSTGLFHSRANLEISAATQGPDELVLHGRIEARFFGGSSLWMSFLAKMYSENSTGVDPSLHRDQETYGSNRIWLLNDSGAVMLKLEEFFNRSANACISEEPSIFMRATLQHALEILKAEDAAKATGMDESRGQKFARTSYNLQNQLLSDVVQLWVQTRLLTTPEKFGLELRYIHGDIPPEEQGGSNFPNDNRESATWNIEESSRTHRLIRCQLLAAMESRCSKLSKTVMSELEKRLLQRQQVSRFATFLSAVILLNCVERMCGLYSSLDTVDEHALPPSDRLMKSNRNESEQGSGSPKSSAMESNWVPVEDQGSTHRSFSPVDTPVSKLWSQGQHFSDLLTMLLRIRALPPKTQQLPDGTLATAQGISNLVHINGQSVSEQIDEQTKTAATWLDPLRLSVAELVRKRDGETSPDGVVEDWDMKFISKLLLPESVV